MSATERRREPVIHGRLTWLRAAERDDVPLFVRWFNDRETVRHLAMRGPMSLAGEERWFDNMVASQGKDSWHFVICLLADDRPIGTTGLFDIDKLNGSAGIGIGIGDPADTGAGYGTDALEALLDFGFGQLRLERMWLHVYDDNGRAVRSYEKAGFAREGLLRHHTYRERQFKDVLAMAILRDEWATRRAATPFPGPWTPADVSPRPPPGD